MVPPLCGTPWGEKHRDGGESIIVWIVRRHPRGHLESTPKPVLGTSMGPMSPSCFLDSQVFWTLILICLHQQKERDCGEMHVGRSDGPGLKGHTPGPANAAATWSCDHREAGKSPPKRGEQLKLSATVSTHFNLFSVQIFIDSLPHASSVWTAAWDLTEQHLGLGEPLPQHRRPVGKCLPSQDKG